MSEQRYQKPLLTEFEPLGEQMADRLPAPPQTSWSAFWLGNTFGYTRRRHLTPLRVAESEFGFGAGAGHP